MVASAARSSSAVRVHVVLNAAKSAANDFIELQQSELLRQHDYGKINALVSLKIKQAICVVSY